MNNFKKLTALFLALILAAGVLAGCGKGQETTGPAGTKPTEQLQIVDYVAQTKLDMSSSTLKQEVTVKNYIDGDTTHFNVPTSISEDGVLKARYLCVNTPESTGKI